ncbi:hypothetical protein Sjap_004524 [Stephania japonica]|uniref:Uncharacterized protein n=1 Tax=Stephania japonica TaxID=461633 RepID=A0AAP0K2N9_9MAGN
MADEEIVGGFADLGEVIDIGVFGEGVAVEGGARRLARGRGGAESVCVVVGILYSLFLLVLVLVEKRNKKKKRRKEKRTS